MSSRLSLLAVLTFVACVDDGACDDDQLLVDGVCVLMPSDASVTDADARGECPADSTDPDQPDPVPFGTSCSDDTTHSECGCPAPFCAIQPGSETGTCTVTGCALDATLCPSGYRCLDLTRVQPELGSFCIPE